MPDPEGGHMNIGNAHQQARLSSMNDRYGVAGWKMRGATMIVTCDDGDEAEVHPDGTVTWASLGGADAHDD
jgi:hypothetical protein